MPPLRSPFASLFADLAGALGALGVDWYLFGAQAALLYGSTRVTADVDVTVRLGRRSMAELVAALEARGFELRLSSDEFLAATRVLPVVHRPSRIPADLVLAGPGLEDLFMDRAQLHDLSGIQVPVATPEDLIVMKVLAGRDKDHDDVREVLRAHAVQHEQVREVLRMLEQALSQSDLLPVFEQLVREA